MLHLRPRGSHWLPEPVRRALTFWRRSIQARVVASTRAALGRRDHASSAGSCSSRPATACSTTGSTPWSAEANDETAEARDRLAARCPAPTSTSPASSRAWSTRSSSAGRPAASTSSWSARRSGRPDRRRRRELHARGSTRAASRPRSRSTSTSAAPTAWTYTTIRTTDADGVDRRVARDRGRLPGAAAGRRADLHALLPLPARRAGGDARPGHPGAAHRRGAAARPGRRA